jgi:hypothetical protein
VTNLICEEIPFSGMKRRVTLVGTDVSEESIASVIRVTRNSELGTTLAATSNSTHGVKSHSSESPK